MSNKSYCTNKKWSLVQAITVFQKKKKATNKSLQLEFTGLGMFWSALTRLLSCSPNISVELIREARGKLHLDLDADFK